MPVKDEPFYVLDSIIQQTRLALWTFQHEILLQYEEGISTAVCHGIRRARGDIVAVLDSDGSHDPAHIPRMVDMVNEKTDIVVASRRWNRYSLHRRVLSMFCNWLARNFLGLHLADPLTAFIVGKRECMEFEPTKGCKFALEILARTPKTRIAEIHVAHIPRKGHKSKLKPMEGIYLLEQLLRLKNEIR